MNRTAITCTLVASSALIGAALVTAGPLDPPAGPVSPTHKTLTEVEPRTGISASNTPGDADSLFRITQPGSYYLTGNITGVSGKSGIEIAADGVTIDLGGFNMQGVQGSLDGITTSGIHGLITVRDGTIGGWGKSGIDLSPTNGGESSLIENIIASGNMANGIRTASLGVVRSCEATNTLQENGYGIRVGMNSVVEGCAAHVNNGSGYLLDKGSTISGCTGNLNAKHGILALDHVNIVGCAADSNGQSGIQGGNGSTISQCTGSRNTSSGINGGAGAIIQNCTASYNGAPGIDTGIGASVIDCSAYSNLEAGIDANGWCLVRGCSAGANVGSGIRVSSNCRILNNTCTTNNAGGGQGAGIRVGLDDNTIDGNLCSDNAIGIDVDAAGNFIARNTCAGNLSNWSVVAGNMCLVVQAAAGGAINGNAGGAAVGSLDPNANFTY